ncbi:hypothetical protein [Paenibacillus pabuli]|nr:hypothetical protein [Paenibacillus pabuli]
MTVFVALYWVLKVIATLLSLWFSGRKLYRWNRKSRNKHKTHR